MRKKGPRRPVFHPGLWHGGLMRFLMRRNEPMRPDRLMRPWNLKTKPQPHTPATDDSNP